MIIPRGSVTLPGAQEEKPTVCEQRPRPLRKYILNLLPTKQPQIRTTGRSYSIVSQRLQKQKQKWTKPCHLPLGKYLFVYVFIYFWVLSILDSKSGLANTLQPTDQICCLFLHSWELRLFFKITFNDWKIHLNEFFEWSRKSKEEYFVTHDT